MGESLILVKCWSCAGIPSLDLEDVAFLVLLPQVQAIVLAAFSPRLESFSVPYTQLEWFSPLP